MRNTLIEKRFTRFPKNMQEVYKSLGLVRYNSSLKSDYLKSYENLLLIAKVLNQGWKPDWMNHNEQKFYPYFNRSFEDFKMFGVHYNNQYFYGFSGLYFKTRELAEYAGRVFIEEYRKFLTLPKGYKRIPPEKEGFDYRELKNMNDVYQHLGIKKLESSEDNPVIRAYENFVLLSSAANGNHVPDWENYDEYKYYPCFEKESVSLVAPFRFAFSLYGLQSSNTAVGSRICFKDEEISDYIGKQFEEEYQKLSIQII